MSYARSLAGVNSQAPGRVVRGNALGGITGGGVKGVTGITMQPRHQTLYSRGKVPDWYRAMQGVSGTSLGDDTLDATTSYQQQSLQLQRDLIAAHKHWADGDKFQKWLAIGATLAIPLSAAIWRALGVGRRKKRP